jgi:hypothetical protein
MTPKEFVYEIKKRRRQFEDFKSRRWGVIVGRMGKDHFQNNFRLGGFVNNGLQKWEPAKRTTSGRKGAGAKYKTLLSSRNHLFSGIQYVPGDRRVTISNPVPYAPAHQFGETIQVPVTAKMRRFAWARYYEAGGGPKGTGEDKKQADAGADEAEFWKRLALTKKTTLSIKLPARPMIGESAELTRAIRDRTDAEGRKILNL